MNKREYISNRIMEQAWHKFVYAYNGDDRKLLIKYIIDHNPIELNSNNPFAVKLSSMGLKNIQKSVDNLDKDKLSILSDEYLKLGIASDLLGTLNRHDYLSKLDSNKIVAIMKSMSVEKISSLEELQDMLQKSRDEYKSIYEEYVKSGICANPYEKVLIPMILLDEFMHYFKEIIGNNSYCELLIDHEEGISLHSYKAINNLLGNRITGDLTLNIFCEPDDWRTFYDQSSMLIENIHDYTTVEYDESYENSMKKILKLHRDERGK